MKANEIRIDNYINAHLRLVQVAIIYPDGVDYRYDENECRFIDYYDVQPITLDEQWLERFGLTKPYNDRYGVKRTFPYKVLDGFIKQRNGVYFFKHGTLEVELPYVHTLQNLYYALKNEELTLNTNTQ